MSCPDTNPEGRGPKPGRIADKPCPHCRKLFYRVSHLEAHIRSHTGEKPFVCDVDGCGSAFKRKDQLLRHAQSHISSKNYSCDYENCQKSFATEAKLRRHMKLHLCSPKYQCDKCHKAYNKKTQLRLHKIEEHNIAEFQCKEANCGMIFCSQSKLDTHGMVHEKKRSYEKQCIMCPIAWCSVVFSSMAAMERHRGTHTAAELGQERVCHPNGLSFSLGSGGRKRRRSIRDDTTNDGDVHNDSACSLGSGDGKGTMAANARRITRRHATAPPSSSSSLSSSPGIAQIDGSGYDDDEGNSENESAYENDSNGSAGVRDGAHTHVEGKAVKSGGWSMMKKFKCTADGCGREFTQSQNLSSHILAVHSVRKPYPCPLPYCGMAFGFKQVLQNHLLNVHRAAANEVAALTKACSPRRGGLAEFLSPPTASSGCLEVGNTSGLTGTDIGASVASLSGPQNGSASRSNSVGESQEIFETVAWCELLGIKPVEV